MQFSEHWLREWVNPAITTETLVEQFTMAGLEIESVKPAALHFTEVFVGEVLTVEPHPGADKLKVCQVNVGSETLQIVCAASNVKPGIKVPVARVGAVLPNDFIIKPAKLRGIDSFGMLCSGKELGLEENSQGLFILDKDAPVGESIRKYLDLDDVILDLDLTPNRADCLSITGLAREIAVLNRCAFTPIAIDFLAKESKRTLEVEIVAEAECPHYAGLVIEGVNASVQSPFWLVEKLRRMGIRSIDPIVDVTNYVMLELGQPLHAFDIERLDEKIVVRYAKPEETLTLLSGETIHLTALDLVIADAKKPLALAGIMGGADSGVTAGTKTIFLESAYFSPEVIAGRARKYGLNTDSAHRFERGVSPALQIPAIYRAAKLILAIGGGQVGALIEKKSELYCPLPRQISLRHARIARVLGITLERAIIEDILARLGMTLQREGKEGWKVDVPVGRFDLRLEEDLIEELARVYGYNNIPPSKPALSWETVLQQECKIPLQRFKSMLVDRDYLEVITYSFVDPTLQTCLASHHIPCVLQNPISPELSVMRTSLWPGLMSAYLYNKNRQQQRLRFFEAGLCFYQTDREVKQEARIAGLISGTLLKEQWGAASRSVDFYDIKADVQALLALPHLERQVTYQLATHPALHPGQCAKIMQNGRDIGILGALHPKVAQELAIKEPIFIFELDLQAIDITELPKFATLSKYPLIRRDLAIVVNDKVKAADLMRIIRETAGTLLIDLQLFDVYQGQGIEVGCKSLALGIYLQHADRTLQDEEVNQLMQTVLQRLENAFGAKLRE